VPPSGKRMCLRGGAPLAPSSQVLGLCNLWSLTPRHFRAEKEETKVRGLLEKEMVQMVEFRAKMCSGSVIFLETRFYKSASCCCPPLNKTYRRAFVLNMHYIPVQKHT